MTIDYQKLARVAQTLSDPRRLHILHLFVDGEEHSVSEAIAHAQGIGELSQPTTSHHLKDLLNSEILTVEKRSVNRYYTINTAYLPLLRELGLS